MCVCVCEVLLVSRGRNFVGPIPSSNTRNECFRWEISSLMGIVISLSLCLSHYYTQALLRYSDWAKIRRGKA